MRNEGIVCILSRTGTYGNESTCLKDLVKRAAVNNEVLDNRESGTAPRLYGDCSAILEMTHKELTSSHVVIWTVSASIDVERAGSADTLAAVVIERNRTAALATSLNCNRISTFANELFVENIEHLKERSIFFDTRNMIGLEMSLCFGVLLTPDFQIKFHLSN